MKKSIVLISLLLLTLLTVGVVSAQSLWTNTYIPVVYGPPAPKATPTATPLPTLSPNDITVLPNYTTYVDLFNNLNIRGEIINNTNTTFGFTEVWVDVLDANHQQLKVFMTNITMDYLKPGEKTCFEIRSMQPNGWKYISFEPVVTMVYTMEIPDLQVSTLGMYYDPVFKSHHVTGKVLNNGAKQANFVKAVATAYNQAGNVIGCNYAEVSGVNIYQGSYSLFDVMFNGDGYADFNTYRVQASGEPSYY